MIVHGMISDIFSRDFGRLSNQNILLEELRFPLFHKIFKCFSKKRKTMSIRFFGLHSIGSIDFCLFFNRL